MLRLAAVIFCKMEDIMQDSRPDRERVLEECLEHHRQRIRERGIAPNSLLPDEQRLEERINAFGTKVRRTGDKRSPSASHLIHLTQAEYSYGPIFISQRDIGSHHLAYRLNYAFLLPGSRHR